MMKGKALVTLRLALGCHSPPSFLFSHLPQPDASICFPPPRHVRLAQYQKEATLLLISYLTEGSREVLCPNPRSKLSSLPTRPAVPRRGLGPVTSHWMTLLHPQLLRIKLFSRFGSGICPPTLLISDAGKTLGMVVKGISCGLSQTWFKIPAALLTVNLGKSLSPSEPHCPHL